MNNKQLTITEDWTISLKGDKVIVYKLEHLNKIFGTSSAGSNPNLYRIERIKGGWAVSKEALLERELTLQTRLDDAMRSLKLLRQVKRQAQWND